MIEDTIGSHLWHLIDNCNAILFVAGNARQMPTDIVDALKTIATKHGHVDNVDEYIAQLEKTDRLQFETWS
jgi:sulfite reductase alpha subunit-like flavoprotein